MSRRGLYLLAALAGVALGQACAQAENADFSLADGGRAVELRREPGSALAYREATAAETAQAGVLAQDGALEALAGRYAAGERPPRDGDRFVAAATVAGGPGACLELRLASSAPVLACDLGDAGGRVVRRFLYPPVWSEGPGEWRFLVPLGDLAGLASFRVSPLSEQATVTVKGAGIVAAGAAYDRAARTIPADCRLVAGKGEYALTWAAAGAPPESFWRCFDLRYDYAAADAKPQTLQVVVQSTDKSNAARRFKLRLRPGQGRIDFHEATMGFVPRRVLLSQCPPGFAPRAFSMAASARRSGLDESSWLDPQAKAPEPLPGDLWALLHLPVRAWRQDFMEVFSWNVVPDTIVVDFASLEVQDRFVKRMVFFVEKKGYRGTLQPNGVIEPKHGWNANDFSAQSLADFYNAAAAARFPLNPEERYLRECLVQWGLLGERQGRLAALKGGLLSIARGDKMSDQNRNLLLQHECLHGVFFARPDFRSYCEKSYAAMNPAARGFIVNYFSFYQYDPADRTLMVNETMAYLLQQGLGGLKSYVTGNMVRAYAQRYPDKEKPFRDQAEAASAELYRTAQGLSRELYAATGLVNGQLSCLVEE